MSEGRSQRKSSGTRARRYLPLLLGLAVFTYVFAQNAWVSEDAYITFRSLEQLFAGNGLGWNPHQRVQVYVHPLWFWFLAAFRLFSPDVFWNAILASFLAGAAMLVVLARHLGMARWLALVLLLVCSKSYVDYTSSGLESPLSSLLLAVFFLALRRVDAAADPAASAEAPSRLAFGVSLLFSLLVLSRPDLATLIVPAVGWALWHLGRPQPLALVRPVLLGLAPLALYLVFSLFYFGFLIPNPAYAKLETGIPQARLLAQGLRYVASLRIFDPLLVLVVLAAFVRGVTSQRPGFRALALGLPLNVVYVIWVGGDFMTGRFFVSAYLVSALLLVAVPWQRAWAGASLLLVLVAGLVAPLSPLRSSPSYYYRTVHGQVGDERGTYFPFSSLAAWWVRDPSGVFPDYRFSRDGFEASRSPKRVVVRSNMGMFGYWAGTEKIVLDQLGLTDPFLARLPSRGLWRIGHFGRALPVGYVESVRSGKNLIANPALRLLYADLRLITQGELMSRERFSAILRRNLGLDALRIPRDYETGQRNATP